VLPYLLKHDVSVFSFDFSGTGQSEGEYVSLGHYEEQDLQTVIDYLRRSREVSAIALWGWSMGAVTAALRASRDSSLAACVLDSPFSDFKVLAGEVAEMLVPALPQVITDIAFKIICGDTFSRAGFNPEELCPGRIVSQAEIPAMFGVAHDDITTKPHHTRQLYNQWGGKKAMFTFEGSHCSARPEWFFEKAATFLHDHLRHTVAHVDRIADRLVVIPVDPDSYPCKMMVGLAQAPCGRQENTTAPDVSRSTEAISDSWHDMSCDERSRLPV